MLVVGARYERPGAGLPCQRLDRGHVEMMPALDRRHHLHGAAAGELLGDPIGCHVTERRERRVARQRSEEHTSELQSPCNLVCRLLLEKKKKSHMTRKAH